MILTKNTPLEMFKDGEPIFIDKEVALDGNLLELLYVKFPNSKITISTFTETLCSAKGDVLYTEEELAVLLQNADMSDKYKRELTFDGEYSLSQAIVASRNLNSNADFINNFKIDGKPLSPLEKFMLAYSIVSDKVYEEDPSNTHNSRNIISTLSGDKIVCAGFANELSVLCARIGIPCAYRINSLEGASGIGNHATCIVNIQDEKYGVNGVFVADPTGDAKQKGTPDCPYNLNFRHFLLTHEEYQLAKSNNQFDRAIMVENSPESGFVHTQIQNINYLFPSIEPDTFLSHEFFNQATHSLDVEKIKKTLKSNIEKTFPKDLQNTSQTNQKPQQDLLDKSVLFHLIFTLSNSDTSKPPPLVLNYYKHMNLNCSSEEILKSLLHAVDEISEQDILQNYVELLKGDEKESRYTDYKLQLEKDLKQTKTIPNRTLLKLFKTILPALFTLTNEEKSKLASELTDSRFDFISSQVASLGH